LRTAEDHFVERKTLGDSKDWLKTAVAFANSSPIGFPAVLYLGVTDEGVIQDGVDLDSVQRSFSEKVSRAYPPIACYPRILRADGKPFLAIVIPGSEERPHFAGQAYAREGPKTIVSSQAQFERLIASRQSKVYELLKWKEKVVHAQWYGPTPWGGKSLTRYGGYHVVDCNQFYVTLSAPTSGQLESVPLRRIDISYLHEANGSGLLKLEIQPV
jgi:hypothetical protein